MVAEDLPDAVAARVRERCENGEPHAEISAWLANLGYRVLADEIAQIAARHKQDADQAARASRARPRRLRPSPQGANPGGGRAVSDSNNARSDANGPESVSLRPDWISPYPSAVILQPTSLCNLDCTYCYLPDRKHRKDMPVAVAQAVAASIPEIWSRRRPVEVVWHGGEPLTIGAQSLRELTMPFEPLRREHRVRYMLQTNATLITDEWCDLFEEFDISVGISIDGPRTQNRERIDRRGREAYDRILKGIHKLNDRAIPFHVLAVVTPAASDHAADVLDFLSSLGTRYIGLNVESKEAAHRDGTVPSLEAARRFWAGAFDWARHNPDVNVREVDRLLEFLAMTPETRAIDAQQDPLPTVAWNGDVVLFSPELMGVHDRRYNNFVAGNVTNEPLSVMVNNAANLNYVREFKDGILRCKETCGYFGFCQGVHPGNRYFEHGHFTATETEHCKTTFQAPVQALHAITARRTAHDTIG